MDQCLSGQLLVNSIGADLHLFGPSDLAVFANVHLVELCRVLQRRKDTLAYGCGHVVKPFYSIIEDYLQFPVRECFYTYGAIHISMD